MSGTRRCQRRVTRDASGLLGYLALLLISGCRPAADDPTADAAMRNESMVQGSPRSIASGKTHPLELDLTAGTFLRVVVEQRGIDLFVRLLNPRDDEIARVDSPNGEMGPEELVAVITEAGRHRLEVVAPADKENHGDYVLAELEHRPASSHDRDWVAADELYHRARTLLRRDPREATPLFQALIATWQELALPMQAANTRMQLFHAYRTTRDPVAALEVGEEALSGYRSLGAERPMASLLQGLGKLYLATGDFELAVRRLDEGRALFEQQANLCGLTVTLSSLGLAHHRLGHLQTAVGFINRALQVVESCEKPLVRAFLLTEAAQVFLDLQRSQDAVEALNRAREIYSEDDGGNPARYTIVLKNLAEAALQTGDLDLAERSIRKALGRYPGDQKRLLAGAYNTLGSILRQRHNFPAAEQALETALTLARESADPRTEAVVLTGLGHLYTVNGQPELGFEHHDEAMRIFERIGDVASQATSRARGAQALRDLGRFNAAWQRLTPALSEIEALRDATGKRDDRLAYFSFYQVYYELACDITLGLHGRRPSATCFPGPSSSMSIA